MLTYSKVAGTLVVLARRQHGRDHNHADGDDQGRRQSLQRRVRVLGDYGQVTLLVGDTGHLTFGRSQTTLGSGNLGKLLDRYCNNPGARFRRLLSPSLPKIAAKDVTLDGDRKLHNVLRASADDQVMRDLQDEFFDEVYYTPAIRAADRMEIVTPLGQTVVYDSFVHGSWPLIRGGSTEHRKTLGASMGRRLRHGAPQLARDPSAQGSARYRLSHGRVAAPDRPRRMGNGATDCRPRHGDIHGQPGRNAAGHLRGSTARHARVGVQDRGAFAARLDVRLLQLGLSQLGADIRTDGVFGRASSRCVADHQSRVSLPVSGVANPPLVLSLATSLGL